jgi:ubiquitin-protein ligase
MARPGAHVGPPAPAAAAGDPLGLHSPRDKRLDRDYRQLMTTFAGHPHVRVEPRSSYPPERYGITLKVPGLRMDEHNRIVTADVHFVELYLPAQYPREKPYATSTYPVFHPNFGAHICIADYWSPAQSLVDIVVQIADMLQYRQYNIHSPLNAVAANWVADNQQQVPVGGVELMPADLVVEIHEESK